MQGRDVPIQDVRAVLPLAELVLTLLRSTLAKPNLMVEMTALSPGRKQQSKRQSWAPSSRGLSRRDKLSLMLFQ